MQIGSRAGVEAARCRQSVRPSANRLRKVSMPSSAKMPGSTLPGMDTCFPGLALAS
jgi:hypothetical protein